MRKTLNQKGLFGRSASRTALAFSLAASLAAFGCTTNRTPGNGEPLRSGPGVGPSAPTSGVTSGSSSGGTVTDQPMMSSSQHIDPLPSIAKRASRLPLSPDEAAAILRDSQYGRSARVLGPVNPGMTGHRYVSDRPDPFNQRGGGLVTLNSSANSMAQVAAIANTDVAVAGTTGVTGASTVAGTGTTATALTPTSAAIPVTPGAFAAGTGGLNPTVASAGIPTPTTASGLATTTGAAAAATNVTPTTASSTISPTSVTSTSATTSVANPVRVIQNTNGTVTVTNSSGGTQKQNR